MSETNKIKCEKFSEIFPDISLPTVIMSTINTGKIFKIALNKLNTKMKIHIVFSKIINEQFITQVEDVLKQKLPHFEDIIIFAKFELNDTPKDIINLYWHNLLFILLKESPLEYSILNNSTWKYENNQLNIIVQKNAKMTLKIKKTDKKIENLFHAKVGLIVGVNFEESTSETFAVSDDFILDKSNSSIVHGKTESAPKSVPKESNSYNNDKPKYQKKSSPRNSTKINNELIGDSVRIKTSIEQDTEIIIEGTIIEFDKREIRSGKYLISIDITDGSDSVTVKFFIDPETYREEFESIVKKGNAVKIKGVVRYDMYAKELNIIASDIMPIIYSSNLVVDDAKIKRVELHLHTNMSTMDAVTSCKDYIKRAMAIGHNAMAITDHGVVQAFPDAMEMVEKSDFKILYGIEAYVIDDINTVVSMDNGQNLDCEYVVFDLETTGLSSRSCTIIEIGAVKIKNGQITDKFSSFVNPHEILSEEIVKLTRIDDAMLTQAPPIEYVLPKFLEFCGECVLVAHNASFDISFINSFSKKLLNKDIENTYIDTVMLSRMLYPAIKNHKLDTVARHLKIELENHHRAVDDAAATSEIFMIELKELELLGIAKLSEINNKAMSMIPDKSLRPDHTIILVKSQVGMRNLYELISTSHLLHYMRRPRMLKSELIQLREGLIVGSACEAGDVYKAVFNSLPKRKIVEVASFYDYLEIQPIGNNMYLYNNNSVKDVSELCKINMEIINLGDEIGTMTVATGDVHFLNPEDNIYRSILMDSKGFKDADNQPPLFYRTTAQMLQEFSYLPEEIAYKVVVTNTNIIADSIEKLLPIPKETYPPSIEGSEEKLTEICMAQARKIYGEDLPYIVSERIERELNSIIKNGFAVMYIIAQKLVWNSLENGYLVGSRGSVGSSLVATMAQITEVNPLSPHYVCPSCCYSEFDSDICKEFAGMAGYDLPNKDCPTCGTKLNKDGHDIPFETFLGFDGDKEPDIDLNFSSEYQAKAHAYTEELFGKGFVFKAGTIGTLADKTAFGYVAKYLENRNIEVRTAEINRLRNGCTGVKKTTGQHPGGLMIVPNDNSIYNFTPVQRPANDTDSQVTTTHFDYHSISGRLLKLDILGHTAPTIIKMLHESTGLDPITVDMGDKDVMSLFTSKKALGLKENDIDCPTGSLGLPEFGTNFVRQMLVETKPSTFSELVRISGLSHGTNVWVGNAQDLVKNGVVTLKEVIPTRDDIMVYLILKGVEKKKAFFIMEAVRKGKGLTEENEQIMIDANIPKWYIDSCKTISYLFPKGHAAAYVIMSVRIAYFKIHYKADFYAATFSIDAEEFDYEIMCKGRENVVREMKRINQLGNEATTKEKSTYSILELLDEMYARQVSFLPLDLYKSHENKFIVQNGSILPPLCTIAGLGSSAAQNIIIEREIEPFTTIEELRNRTKVNKNVVEIMKNNNMLNGIPETNQLSLF